MKTGLYQSAFLKITSCHSQIVHMFLRHKQDKVRSVVYDCIVTVKEQIVYS